MPARKKRRLLRGLAKAIRGNGLNDTTSKSKVVPVLTDPSLWKCSITQTTDNLWICLGDGVIRTFGSSHTVGLAAEHSRKTGHGLWLRLNEDDGPDFFSYAREAHLKEGEEPKSAKELLKIIRKVRTSKRAACDQRGLGYVTEQIISERQFDDKISRAFVLDRKRAPETTLHQTNRQISVLSRFRGAYNTKTNYQGLHLEKPNRCQVFCELGALLGKCSRRERNR